MTRFEDLTERYLAALRAAGGEIAAACPACVRVLPVRRAAIVIDEHDAGLQPWCASDPMAAGIEAAQATAGEGPAVDAVATGLPVGVADLTDIGGRWPGFAAALTRLDVTGGMFAVPLHLDGIRLGALDLYRDTPGCLDTRTRTAALHIADLITAQLVLMGRTPCADHPMPSRVLHQAAGMVVAQLDIPVADAYTYLRAYAFTHGLSLAEVADAVVARRIGFDLD
ncbi:GAF and ANTAR domain-containing protein [Nocardia terpenica]|uniref:GAF and ANTAR domain-containing protein n=1 Tax=Nocardia terpenica TaxID=455432 RepID=UPI001894E25A|nr:GAF and ANTAR domain-containing protein [Nocardia terpenica]MBF6061512.1 GAF and ANTAR domain-containing protein [Nocardia terpenica]MBF6105259.1 GAF and ANTAR domain-containing protein [Nocardia terpenica]MBF6113271.1 GAF and ANTAR domain-containing protein [Nocardia terpenica]MBF6119401.1 GAF and ANTAR domain-containing protein [Nocardia terpenica]MBF6153049.1 GAF and ANTAR domain-containing protein [Nocardia terpenica]